MTSSLAYINGLAHEVHDPGNIGASISSGSFHSEGMIVAPCSSQDDVEYRFGQYRRPDQPGGRRYPERAPHPDSCRDKGNTPAPIGHLETLTKLARIGAVIFPPVPAFYNRPASHPWRSSISPACGCLISFTFIWNLRPAGARRVALPRSARNRKMSLSDFDPNGAQIFQRNVCGRRYRRIDPDDRCH